MERWVLDKILEIAALIKYNGEKRDFIEKALKRFLVKPQKNFSIEKEVKKIFYNKGILKNSDIKRDFNNMFTSDELFEDQDYILTIDVSLEDLFFYIFEKYRGYDSKLKKEIGVTITEIIKFCSLIQNVYYHDLFVNNYKFNKNILSKKEYFYPHKLQYPDRNSGEISEVASFISKDAFVYFLKNAFKNQNLKSIIKNIDLLFDLISFTQEDIIKDNKIRFQDKPLLKINKDSYVLLNEVHLLWGLPYRLDSLLNKYRWYTDTKGKAFEKVVFKVLEGVNDNKRIGASFFQNIKYGDKNKFELDGLINFKDHSWFIECKGRIPRSRSFKGNSKSVEYDIKKGISDAEDQALRAIKEAEINKKIGNYRVKDNKGILVIVEGMYPNLNQNPLTQFKRKDENYPRYIISFLTLMEILRQYDAFYLKKFLEWRSDPNMPISCSSELDYWDYFTSMQAGLDKKEGYDLAKKKNIKVLFIGKRFNAPKFIKSLDK